MFSQWLYKISLARNRLRGTLPRKCDTLPCTPAKPTRCTELEKNTDLRTIVVNTNFFSCRAPSLDVASHLAEGQILSAGNAVMIGVRSYINSELGQQMQWFTTFP